MAAEAVVLSTVSRSLFLGVLGLGVTGKLASSGAADDWLGLACLGRPIVLGPMLMYEGFGDCDWMATVKLEHHRMEGLGSSRASASCRRRWWPVRGIPALMERSHACPH